MPKWPNAFFQDVSTLSYDFDNDPSGELVLERILNSMPAFLHLSGEEATPEKKKLIINNWYLKHYRKSEKETFKAIIISLLAAGFELYQVDGKRLVQLASFADFSFDCAFNPDPHQLKRMTALAEISKDESLFVDYALFNIVGKRTFAERPLLNSLSIEDLIKAALSEKVMAHIISSAPSITLSISDLTTVTEDTLTEILKKDRLHLYIDDTSADTKELLAILARINPASIKSISHRASKELPKEVTAWVRQISLQSSQLEELHYSGGELTVFDHVPLLKKLTITKEISLTQLQAILQKLPRLKHLEFSAPPVDDIEDSQLDTSQIKKLSLLWSNDSGSDSEVASNSEVDSDSDSEETSESPKQFLPAKKSPWLKILKGLQHLEELIINDLSNEDLISISHLRKLQALDLTGNEKLQAVAFAAILNANPKIQTLALEDIEITGELPEINLNQLSSLTLNECFTDASESDFANLFGHLPPLDELNLKYVNIPHAITAPKVKNLNLFRTRLDGGLFKTFIEHAETAHIYSLTLVSKLPSLNLRQLSELDIKQSEFSYDDFFTLLRNAQNLTQLNLTHVSLRDKLSHDHPLNLQNLRVLDVRFFNGSEAIYALLSKAIRLESAFIQGSQIDQLTGLRIFPNMSRLHLKDVTISAQALSEILKNTPNLKYLNLENVKIEGDITLPLQLSELVEFSYTDYRYYHRVEASSFMNMISKSRKLKKLYLDGLKFQETRPTVELEDAELFSLEKVRLDYVHCSSQLFERLFKHSQKVDSLHFWSGDFTGEAPEINLPLLSDFAIRGGSSFNDKWLSNILRGSEAPLHINLNSARISEKIFHELIEAPSAEKMTMDSTEIRFESNHSESESRVYKSNIKELSIRTGYQTDRASYARYITTIFPSLERLHWLDPFEIELNEASRLDMITDIDLSVPLSFFERYPYDRQNAAYQYVANVYSPYDYSERILKILAERYILSSTKVNDRDIYYLINNKRQLRTLNLQNASVFGKLKPFVSPNLLHVNLKNASISLENLQYLIQGASAHVTINIDGCHIEATETELMQFVATYKSKLKGSPIRSDNLYDWYERLEVALREEDKKNPFTLTTKKDPWGIKRKSSSTTVADTDFDGDVNSNGFDKDAPRSSAEPNPTSSGHHRALINQLIAYIKMLHLPPSDESKLIADFNRGLCNAIAHYYADVILDHGPLAFQHAIKTALDWDGVTVTKSIQRIFDDVFYYSDTYQRGDKHEKYRALTTDIKALIESNTQLSHIFIGNAWHQTVLIKTTSGWLFFDPNYTPMKGKPFTEVDALCKEIHRVLGQGLTVQSNKPLSLPEFKEDKQALSTYITEGGLLNILRNIKYHHLLKKLASLELDFTILSKALFAVSTHGIPAWSYGIQQTRTRRHTFALLQKASLQAGSDFIYAFNNSYLEMSPDDKATTKYFLQLAAKNHSFAQILLQTDAVRLQERVTYPSHLYGNNDSGESYDANTEPSKHTEATDVKKLFYSSSKAENVPVSKYRLAVFNTLSLSESSARPFILSNPDELQLQETHLKYYLNELLPEIDRIQSKTRDDVYVADIDLDVSRDWQALPSLTAFEKIHHVYASDHLDDIEIQYSLRDNLYYIRSKTRESFSINLQYSLTVANRDLKPLPEAIQQLIERYNKFSSGALVFDTESPTPAQQLAAIKDQQKGACRHRMIAFFDEIKEHFTQFPIRMVTNEIHAYVEIYYDGHWYHCDLGGYPLDLNIIDKHMPSDESQLQEPAIDEPTSPTSSAHSDGEERDPSPLVESPTAAEEEIPGQTQTLDKAREDSEASDVDEHQVTKELTDETVKLVTESFVKLRKLDACPPSHPFRTWDSALKEQYPSLSAFELDLLTRHVGQNCLLSIDNNQRLESYKYRLLQKANELNQPVFIINDIHDVKCAKSSLLIDERFRGSIVPAPSGALYDFLETHRDSSPPPIIIVNWNNFSAKEIVKANTLIDALRKADGTLIPDKATVIGLYNPKKPDAYQGSDFSSRHHYITPVPYIDTLDESLGKIQDTVIENEEAQLPSVEEESSVSIEIDLFNSVAWQSLLFGQWRINRNQLDFAPSPLLLAIAQKPQPEEIELTLYNAPDGQPDFVHQMNMMVQQGYIDYFGRRFPLPKKLSINYQRGYEFQELLRKVSFNVGVPSKYDYPLNPSNTFSFYQSYEIDDSRIITGTGILEEHEGGELNIYVTQNISLSQWAKFLKSARTLNISLNITLAPDVQLDGEMLKHIEFSPLVDKATISDPSPYAELHFSNDIAFTEKELIDSSDPYIAKVVDVSELSTDSVFYKVQGQLSDSEFIFQQTMSDIWRAVYEEGETILLKGNFSAELASQLAPLLNPKLGYFFGGEYLKPRGKLILLTDNSSTLSYALPTTTHEVGLVDKLSILPSLKKYSSVDLNKLSFSQLQVLAKKQASLDTASQLLSPLYTLKERDEISSDFDLSRQSSDEFTENRLNKIQKALSELPIVFLSGKTGVGKSSFMHQLHESKDLPYQVFFGNTETWARANYEDKELILFIDEANLENTDWSMFETLFSDPPSITLNGTYFPLSRHHKVVFAGNPLSYGGERTLPKLFANHPNVVTFDALPNAFLYHKVLHPLLNEMHQQTAEAVGTIFLKAYQKVKSLNEKGISARELQMMAFLLRTQLSKRTRPSSPPVDKQLIVSLAESIAKEVSLQCLENNKKSISDFNGWFSKEIGPGIEVALSYPEKVGDFVLKPSHHGVYDKLLDLIKVREVKRDKGTQVRYGGISGMTLEGEPGLGKSHLVKSLLLAHGFTERKPIGNIGAREDSPEATDNVFYYLPASSSIDVKIKTLTKAFHQGAVVIADELNSSVTLEKLINALLVGEDLDGKRAAVPGFTLLATQNPISFAGRKKTSLAIKRRMWQCQFKCYTSEEMVSILEHKGLTSQQALSAVIAFNQATAFAKENHLEPPPSFRDLIYVAENYSAYQDRVDKENGFFTELIYQYLLEDYMPKQVILYQEMIKTFDELSFDFNDIYQFPFKPYSVAVKEQHDKLTQFIREMQLKLQLFTSHLEAIDANFESHPKHNELISAFSQFDTRDFSDIRKHQDLTISYNHDRIKSSGLKLLHFFKGIKPRIAFKKHYFKEQLNRLIVELDNTLTSIQTSLLEVDLSGFGVMSETQLLHHTIGLRRSTLQQVDGKKAKLDVELRSLHQKILALPSKHQTELQAHYEAIKQQIMSAPTDHLTDIISTKEKEQLALIRKASPIFELIQDKIKVLHQRSSGGCLFNWMRLESQQKSQTLKRLISLTNKNPLIFIELIAFKDRHGNFSNEDLLAETNNDKKLAMELFNALNVHRHFWNRSKNQITTDDKSNQWQATQTWKNLCTLFNDPVLQLNLNPVTITAELTKPISLCTNWWVYKDINKEYLTLSGLINNINALEHQWQKENFVGSYPDYGVKGVKKSQLIPYLEKNLTSSLSQ